MEPRFLCDRGHITHSGLAPIPFSIILERDVAKMVGEWQS